jgi:LAS superfamily LD-carboxypeptidase LdcB
LLSPDAPYGLSEQTCLHLLPEVEQAFHRLQVRAAQEGIHLLSISTYRSFDRQLVIWNRKANGKLAILDDQGLPLTLDTLSERDRVFSILRWSALPGASRHHWRTDMDVYDGAVISPDYQVRLTQSESAEVFGHLHQWLSDQIEAGTAEGFYRPYDRDRGGTAPEPWHLSYRPQADVYARAFSLERWREILQQTDFALKETVLTHLEEIYRRFVQLPV